MVSRSPYRVAVRTTARASTPAAGKIHENVYVTDSPACADFTMSQPARPIRAADAAAGKDRERQPRREPAGKPGPSARPPRLTYCRPQFRHGRGAPEYR